MEVIAKLEELPEPVQETMLVDFIQAIRVAAKTMETMEKMSRKSA